MLRTDFSEITRKRRGEIYNNDIITPSNLGALLINKRYTVTKAIFDRP